MFLSGSWEKVASLWKQARSRRVAYCLFVQIPLASGRYRLTNQQKRILQKEDRLPKTPSEFVAQTSQVLPEDWEPRRFGNTAVFFYCFQYWKPQTSGSGK